MSSTTRLVEVRQHVLKQNDVAARALRSRFRAAGVYVVSLVSSPGAGKTAFLERTLTELARTHRAELHRRHPGPQEGDRVRRAVTPHAHHPLGMMRRGSLAEALYERRVGLDDRRRSAEGGEHAGVGQPAHLLEDLVGVLVGQEADIDVYDAGIGHFVQGVAAHDPTEIDGGPIEQGGAVTRKR